jgi:hypothetical protein
MSEFLQSSAFRQLLQMLLVPAVPLLNAKFNLGITDAQVEAVIMGLVTSVIASKVANAHVAGKEAAAKVVTVSDAAAVLSESAIPEKKE